MNPPPIFCPQNAYIWSFRRFSGNRHRNCQIDLCELLGSGKPPENGTISHYKAVRSKRAGTGFN
jgi:hypothetical protein